MDHDDVLLADTRIQIVSQSAPYQTQGLRHSVTMYDGLRNYDGLFTEFLLLPIIFACIRCCELSAEIGRSLTVTLCEVVADQTVDCRVVLKVRQSIVGDHLFQQDQRLVLMALFE